MILFRTPTTRTTTCRWCLISLHQITHLRITHTHYMQAAVSPETTTTAAAAAMATASSISTALRRSAATRWGRMRRDGPNFSHTSPQSCSYVGCMWKLWCSIRSSNSTANPSSTPDREKARETVSQLKLELCVVVELHGIFCVCWNWDGLRCLINEKKYSIFKRFYFRFENRKSHVVHLLYIMKILMKNAWNI